MRMIMTKAVDVHLQRINVCMMSLFIAFLQHLLQNTRY